MSNAPTGIIVATYPSNDPQMPDVISYDVSFEGEDGSEVVVRGVTTAYQQTNVKVWPARPGQPFCIHWLAGNQPLFMIVEPPYFAECVPPTGGG